MNEPLTGLLALLAVGTIVAIGAVVPIGLFRQYVGRVGGWRSAPPPPLDNYPERVLVIGNAANNAAIVDILKRQNKPERRIDLVEIEDKAAATPTPPLDRIEDNHQPSVDSVRAQPASSRPASRIEYIDRTIEVPVEVRVEVPVETIVEKTIEVERIVYRALPEDLSSYRTLVEIMRNLADGDPSFPMLKSPEKFLTWKLGRMARTLHVECYGVPPRKVTRTKTKGSGSHDFAGYPAEFVGAIERLIVSYLTALQLQPGENR